MQHFQPQLQIVFEIWLIENRAFHTRFMFLTIFRPSCVGTDDRHEAENGRFSSLDPGFCQCQAIGIPKGENNYKWP